MIANPNGTAQLWVGSHEQTVDAAIQFAQKVTTACKGCRACSICRAIAQRQWPRVVWATPGPHGHSKESIEEGLASLNLAVEAPYFHVFIVEQAEQLLPASANRLLKPLEEPPPGWYILLLTDRPATLLATIRSRCLMYTVQDFQGNSRQETSETHTTHPTISWLKNPQPDSLQSACSAIDTLPKTPHETIELMEGIIIHWHNQWTTKPEESPAWILLPRLIKIASKPPSPGGSTAFWRLLIISIYRILFKTPPA